MIRGPHTGLIALALLAAPVYQQATSQDRPPPVPSKQIPPATGRIDEHSPLAPLTDTSIERTSQVTEGDVTVSGSPLNELAWTVGDWVDDGENPTFESSVRWSKNNAFLIHSFRVSIAGAEPRSGMQVIAWDPAEKRIRSWTYDSRGGFGEGIWSRSGDQWSIRKRFTLPDGGRASGVQVMARVSDDAFRWKSVNRVIDGSLQPDTDEMTIIRKSSDQARLRLRTRRRRARAAPSGGKQP